MFNKIKISIPITILLICLNSSALTYYVLATQPSSNGSINLLQGPLILLLSFIPVVLIGLFLYFLTNSGFISLTLLNIIFVAFGFVNRYKSILRQDPLLPSDFQLASEFFAIVTTLNTRVLIFSAIAIIGLLLFFYIAFMLLDFKKISIKPRLICLIATVITMVLSNNIIYANEKLNESLTIRGHVYFLVDVYASKGAIYSFLYEWNTNKVEKPPNYDKSIVAKNIVTFSENLVKSSDVKPNIIVIMGEAFSEISENKGFDFSNYNDPIKNFKNLKEEGLSGNIIVPHVGGGTADTEFDMLTGAATLNFKGVPYGYRMLNKKTESITWQYKNDGYNTVAIHPGYPWFYNRQNAYQFLGFDEFIHIDHYKPEEFVKRFVREDATYNTIRNKIAENEDNPLFLFCVTIQNHGVYNDKYDDATLNFDTTLALNDTDINVLYNYFYGLNQMDIELKNLTDFLNKKDEPYVVVYFGDHLPTLTANIYSEMNKYIEEENDFLRQKHNNLVPYLIWQNDSYKNINGDISDIKVGYKNTIASNNLGVLLLNETGYGKSSPFFIFLNEYFSKYVTSTDTIVWDNNGNTIDKTSVPIADLYDNWIYFQIKDAEY